ncbi:unnamed protein product [Discosporangium mesarthrocarpum]
MHHSGSGGDREGGNGIPSHSRISKKDAIRPFEGGFDRKRDSRDHDRDRDRRWDRDRERDWDRDRVRDTGAGMKRDGNRSAREARPDRPYGESYRDRWVERDEEQVNIRERERDRDWSSRNRDFPNNHYSNRDNRGGSRSHHRSRSRSSERRGGAGKASVPLPDYHYDHQQANFRSGEEREEHHRGRDSWGGRDGVNRGDDRGMKDGRRGGRREMGYGNDGLDQAIKARKNQSIIDSGKEARSIDPDRAGVTKKRQREEVELGEVVQGEERGSPKCAGMREGKARFI